jgi:hypothetical protein
VISAGWAVLPAGFALLLMIAPMAPRRWRLPGSGWAAQWDLAGRWARAALALRWRLTEAQAVDLLGADLAGMGAVLGIADGEEHCRMLAEWHRRAARRRLAVTAWATAALILAAGGGIVLGRRLKALERRDGAFSLKQSAEPMRAVRTPWELTGIFEKIQESDCPWPSETRRSQEDLTPGLPRSGDDLGCWSCPDTNTDRL